MQNVTVNLTTTLNRQHLCAQTVWSLLNQSITPRKIRVWASKEPYLIDTGFQSPPKWVDELNRINNIIEFRWTKNIGPYRKLIPALREANEDEIIVYADDDTLYQEQWLKLLITKFIEYGGEYVTASRVRKKRKNIFGLYTSYMLWPIVSKEAKISDNFIITGIGGAAIKRSHIKESYINNNDFLRVCPKADDFWISHILQKSNSSVITVPDALDEIVPIEHSMGLAEENRLNAKSYLMKITNKIKILTLGNLGISICNNDEAQKSISKYSQDTQI
ncbi:glycosyltransferase [Pseudomonas sp. PDM19]|uniref:glycosyltransferase n=1 Tax=Pseudomonas sp. PDM19 TaxID=2769272 RepID=UPI0017865EED|nr:glycosyltransferase [Pseudomonas sp. PDM19]MBD9632590.1 glycosyltransferase [Pseudomonas sp. PDM19]